MRKPWTDEQRATASLRQTGRKYSDDAKRKMSLAKIGKEPPNKGIPHSKETKNKISSSLKNEKAPAWKGDKVGSRAIHLWVERIISRQNFCSNCKQVKNRIHLANRDHKYQRDIQDYIPLCAKCHKHYDMSGQPADVWETFKQKYHETKTNG